MKRRVSTPPARRELRLQREAVRTLDAIELREARGALRATGDACASVDPCPGEYSWFCVP